VKLITLAHLAADIKERRTSNPGKPLGVFLIGYLTAAAASDSVKEEIERGLMAKSISALARDLAELGVPMDKIYVGEMVFSGQKGRKIDIFLQQQGEAAPNLPGNSVPGRTGAPDFRKSPKDGSLNVTSGRELVMEVTVYEVKSSRRTIIPELSFKSSTGISPTEIYTGFSSQLTLWKPKLESALKRIGQQGIADKVEFSLKIVGGGARSKEFANQISVEAAAALKAALNIKVTIPGTRRELPIELSYSYGGSYKASDGAYLDGRFAAEGKGMISVTLFRFNSW
jgi:hypothetical protein